MYYYTFLSELEFFEFIARTADEMYHISFANKTQLGTLKEKYSDIKKDKKMSDEEKKELMQKVKEDVAKRSLCLERLEFKMYELLKQHFEPIAQLEETKIRSSLNELNVPLKKQSVLAVDPKQEGIKEFEQRKKVSNAVNPDFEKLKKIEEDHIAKKEEEEKAEAASSVSSIMEEDDE